MVDRISRRDFLRFSSWAAAGLLAFRYLDHPLISNEASSLRPELVSLERTIKLPSLEYHDPYFEAKDAIMTPEVFSSQLNYLKKAGYYTPTAEEVANFLNRQRPLPCNSVVLRFDLGMDKIDPHTQKSVWPEVFKTLKEMGLHGLIFAIPEAIGSLDKSKLNWDTVCSYVKSGTISLCSHGLPDHPDYRKIDSDYALFSMKESRRKLMEALSQRGIRSPVLGFAFPFDAVPENAKELVLKAGYQFYAGGTKKNGSNFAKIGDFCLPAIYPYVSKTQIEEINKYNRQSNWALLPIKGGLSLPDTLIANGDDIPYDTQFDKFLFDLTSRREYHAPTEIFVNPPTLIPTRFIIIHTDSQPGDPSSWTAEGTFFGSYGEKRKVAVHFGVDQNGPIQFIPLFSVPIPNEKLSPSHKCLLFPLPKPENSASQGVLSAINIEMAGQNYDEILTDPSHEAYPQVNNTIVKTAHLVSALIRSSPSTLDLSKVYGHFEMTYRGKSDPGEKTMKTLRKIVDELLRQN